MEATRIPLSRVTLYKNNLGFLEREIELEANVEQGSTFAVSVPIASKRLVVDTMAVTAPLPVTIK
jgi:hypothetical protein